MIQESEFDKYLSQVIADEKRQHKSWKEAYDAINTEPAQSSDKV